MQEVTKATKIEDGECPEEMVMKPCVNGGGGLSEVHQIEVVKEDGCQRKLDV